MSEQVHSKGVVESFHNCPVSVNIHLPAMIVWFVIFHLFGYSVHELVPWVHFQKLWLFQRPKFVNFLKRASTLAKSFEVKGLFETAGDIDDS